MPCDDVLNAQEIQYLDALQAATGYTIQGTGLTVSYDGGTLNFAPES